MWKYSVAAAAIAMIAVVNAQSTINTPPPPPPSFPPVIVEGIRIDGRRVLCTGTQCADVLRDMQMAVMAEPLPYEATLPDTDPTVDGEAFCENLADARPSGCSASNPPPSPGITVPGKQPWQANGCGTGGFANLFADVILTLASSNYYSGNLDAPYPGVGFRGACDGHDQCWAMAGEREACDRSFQRSMESACDQLGEANARGACYGFAGLYRGAVSSTNASDAAYQNSIKARACALWANDMRENGCED